MRVLPILFNTDMVQAILRKIAPKTATRRIIKGYIPDDAIWGYTAFTPKGYISCRGTFEDGYGEKFFKLPYRPDDIIYVRETFAWEPCWDCGMDTEEHNCCDESAHKIYNHKKHECGCYTYKASVEDNVHPSVDTWHPSIHMPKEAARIWLKVTDVRVERLQDMTLDDPMKEGIYFYECPAGFTWKSNTDMKNCYTESRGAMRALWDSTIKKSELDRYGWDANPRVWVIEFERCEKLESRVTSQVTYRSQLMRRFTEVN